jgi:ankyrin repeat protein
MKYLAPKEFRMSIRKVCLLFLVAAAAFAQNASSGNDASDRFYQAVRNDDLTTLRALIKDNGANAKDYHGQTPLMFAAAYGSLDAMKLLISSGADVKAENDAGATALHWGAGDVHKVQLLLESGADVNKVSRIGRTPLIVAAGTSGTLESVKLLLEKGADVNAADSNSFTPLIVAAGVDNAAAAKLLVEKGANVNAKADTGQEATALMGAAHNGNVDLTRFLLAHKADVTPISADRSGNVKNGPVAFGNDTALHFAVTSGSTETVRIILDATVAANPSLINAKDVRGMTPIVFAVSTDRPNVEIVRMLLAKGADPKIQTNNNESAFDWAHKFNNPPILAALKTEAGSTAIPAFVRAIADVKNNTPQQAVERSLPLLQRTAASVFTDGGCVACHAQPIVGMALDHAHARGWRVDDSVGKSWAAESLRVMNSLNAGAQVLLQSREGGGNPDTQVYDSMMMITAGVPATQGTDAVVHYLASKQRPAGNWYGIGATRAPIQDGDFSRTAMAIRTLAAYGMAGRKAEWQERIGRAADWLAKQTPLSTEDRVMQILGLKWASTGSNGAATATTTLREKQMRQLARALTGIQRSDGGWAQTPYLASDAYATGQALYTLHEMGVSSSDPAFRRGADFLLKTQKEDGSWYVKSRAMKIQPYFQSGFPYDHDQWISTAATAWAVMGLSLTATEGPTLARK